MLPTEYCPLAIEDEIMNTIESRIRGLLHAISELRDAPYTIRGMYFDQDGLVQRAIDESLQADVMTQQVL